MEANDETPLVAAKSAAPGIVIRDRFGPPPVPRIVAFIWGGKVRPVPAIPYGRGTG